MADPDLTGVSWPRFPYPGLRPFRTDSNADESTIFFGRTENKDDILERLNVSQFVSVVGPSGCGKSSLVKVGVIPALEAGLLTRAGYDWITLQMRPGQDPLTNLATAFATMSDQTAEAITILLANERSGLWLLMDRLAPQFVAAAKERPKRLLLLLDQFEEVFSGVQSPEAVDQFIGLITQFFRRPHPQLYIIMTMRTDFIGQCANFPGLAEILNRTQYITPVLRGNGLRDAIVRPAETYGGTIEPALVEEIVKDMGAGSAYNADHLPLMQHALLWLWRRNWLSSGLAAPPCPSRDVSQTGGHINLGLDDYIEHGGITGILNFHADEVFSAVCAQDGRYARLTEITFRRLSERDDAGRYKRAPSYVSELCALGECTPVELRPVVNAFAAADASFLEERVGSHGDPQIDLGHESLIRQWRRLRGWADREAEKVAKFRKIAEDAMAWQNQRKSAAFLPRGGRLEVEDNWWQAAEPSYAWADRYSLNEGQAGQLSSVLPLVEEYRIASQTERSREVSVEKSRRLYKGAVVVIASLVLIVIGCAGFWVKIHNQQEQLAANVRFHVRAAQVLINHELTHNHGSKTLAVTKEFLDNALEFPEIPTLEAFAYRELLQWRETRMLMLGNTTYSIGFSPHGDWFAVTNGNVLCILQVSAGECNSSATPPQNAYPLKDDSTYSGARWNLDGSRLLLAGKDLQPPLIVPVDVSRAVPHPDIQSAFPLRTTPAGQRIGVAVFSPDGTRIATGGDGQPFRIWSASTGEMLADQKSLRPSSSFFLAVNANNKVLAEALTDGGARLYDIDEAAHDIVLRRQAPQIIHVPVAKAGTFEDSATRAIAFAPNNPSLLLIPQGRKAYIVDIAKPNTDNQMLRSDSQDGPSRDGKSTGIITQVAFSNDGTRIATGDSNGVIRAWSYDKNKKGARSPDLVPGVAITEGVAYYFLSFSPDNEHIAALGRDEVLHFLSVNPALYPEISNAEPTVTQRKSQDRVADGSGALAITDSKGNDVILVNLPNQYHAALEADDADWIVLAPNLASAATDSSGLSDPSLGLERKREMQLFSRNALDTPIELPIPSITVNDDQGGEGWASLSVKLGSVVGVTLDGHRYTWRLFNGRKGLSDVIKKQAEVRALDESAHEYQDCLLGLTDTKVCLTH